MEYLSRKQYLNQIRQVVFPFKDEFGIVFKELSHHEIEHVGVDILDRILLFRK